MLVPPRASTPPPRNAITSLTFTPFILKTASVPTSAKLYQAVPLDGDLHNELAGATIEEDPLWDGNHFVQDFYETFLKSGGSKVPALSELEHNGMQLYDTHSKCWQPIYLPYIFRFSSNSRPATRNRGRGEEGSKVQTSEAPSRSTRNKNQRRTVTITRTVEDPDMNPVVETEEITYLPKPGSEEGKVAAWLNNIVAALRSAVRSQRINTRSRTKTLGDAHRIWSAEFATKPLPTDLEIKMKPDIALLRKDPFDPTGPDSWRNVVSFLEMSSGDDFSRITKQIARKTYAVFAAQPGRRFVIVLSIFRLHFRLHLFDRAGRVQSRGYCIHTYAQYLLQVIYALVFAPDELVGYDPTLSYSSVITRAVRLRVQPTIKVGKKVFEIVRLLFKSDMVRGRATLCFVVVLNGRRYVVKICWSRNGRATTEEQMLTRIKERGLTYGVPKLVMAWTVQIGGKDDSTALRRPEYLLSGDEQPEIRLHRRLVVEPVGIPLEAYTCLQELISMFIDIVDVHEVLVEGCEILHRDLSIKNMMSYVFDYDSESWPIRSNDDHIRDRLSAREELLRQRKYRRGLLIDFDYAKFMDRTDPISEGERTGTIPFMALSILHAFGSPAGFSVAHEPKHDLESIVYVLVWICVLHSRPGVVPIPAHTTCLNPWASCKSLQQVEALWSTKTGELTTHVPLQHFTSYFQGLKPFTERLYSAILKSHLNVTPLTHDVLRDILLDAFFQLDEPTDPMQPARRGQPHLEIADDRPMRKKAGAR